MLSFLKQCCGKMADPFLKAYPADSDPHAAQSAIAWFGDAVFGWEMREWDAFDALHASLATPQQAPTGGR
jgi:hypothetical protein